MSVRRLSPLMVAVSLLVASCSSSHAKQSAAPSTAPTTSTSTSTTATTQPFPITTTTSQPVSTTTTMPSQPGLRVLDLTWISDTQGWALVFTPCGPALCGAILATTDGGVTWARSGTEPPQPAAAGLQHLRFATPTVGYVWGQTSGLFMTTDGGKTWSPQPVTQPLALEPVRGFVVRIQAPQGYPGPVEVDRAAVGSTSWQAVNVGTTGYFGGEIVSAGSWIYLAFGGHRAGGEPDAHTAFSRSADGGATWTPFGDPCGNPNGVEYDAVSYAASPDGHFAVTCGSRLVTGAVTVMMSADGGIHFGPAQPTPIPAAADTQLALAGTVLLAASTDPGHPATVYRSADGGHTWTQTLTAAAPTMEGSVIAPWLGFEDSTTGRVTFGANTVWTTTDAGATWRQNQVP